MTTLRTRLAALEAGADKPGDTDGLQLVLGSIMGEAEWCEAAKLQQAQLVKDTYEQNA
jgi:hypothetical protein